MKDHTQTVSGVLDTGDSFKYAHISVLFALCLFFH